ncbi:carbohydrate ABC transporter membrane protein 1 (CUT1 family) [Curtobacterium sp. PhB142]|uniref:carbohydrate ABC transporter permease n=1 Tax=Bacteria TaxID=2 RepID=UPI000FA2542C|nr:MULTISPECIES: sugar ABC transporter permease [Curtobacterium]ROQ07210.1 carbohydrate ABC transporter membrane protein 1 (CUT1 family) [Curtobacterium sp. PhB171]ROQ28136.1 carbohydrate ABC transporter membrane protein 1 (CUT1 family) [Curtobacterium sp. PhB170]ROS35066.1 carbohydrate ABC transporter membrane protein 1 (CUT1 family) [Curtobacterium sp. PhB131]ROS47343.1 carbohydrate ABC transporter membrane protein 1 (CUT1 family) [Curtobacterium sp. PhB78]ROS64181.1 carbohydrate ABC transpo
MTATLTTALEPAKTRAGSGGTGPARKRMRSFYPAWFFIPAIALYVVFFAVPTFAGFYFSLTRWTLFDQTFIGFDNFVRFFQDPQLVSGFVHTFQYGFVTSAAKVVIGLALALLLTSPVLGRGYLRAVVFFPVLVSTIGIGITFKALMDPFHGIINGVLGSVGLPTPGWLTDPALALWSVAAVDVWKGVGIATLIFIAGIVAIPQEYFEAARVDGASAWSIFRNITLPLSRPAMGTVIILSLIGGLRSFDLIWAMTGGGPGFTSDVIASVIYKQYQAGFYGLSTAGNVVLFVVVTAIMVPISWLLNRKEADL